MEQQPPARAGDRDVLAVREAEDDTSGRRVDTDDPVRERPGVRDAVDDGRGARDRAAEPVRPEQPRRSRAETP